MTPEVSQEQITVSESECYEITHIREKSGFAAGVLVAVSIPIFTAQLSKARIATNQANLRAAKAAAVADYLVNESVNGEGADYVYTISSGTVAAPVAFTKAGPITDITDTKQISSTSNYTAITVHIDKTSVVTFTAS